MLVDEQLRKCVSFLYEDQTRDGVAQRRPVGTVFFISVGLLDPNDASGYSVVYAVTARHVVEDKGLLWLRMRAAGGGFNDRPVDPDSWECHPQTDIAVAPLPTVTGIDDIIHLPISTFATEAFVAQHEVAEGDDVFFSGLFVGHYGETVPQPIVRFGNIALNPREPVEVEIRRHPRTFARIEAYLVEARSWGGQSGSPAFLSLGPNRHMGSINLGGAPPFALLGVV